MSAMRATKAILFWRAIARRRRAVLLCAICACCRALCVQRASSPSLPRHAVCHAQQEAEERRYEGQQGRCAGRREESR